MNETEFKLKYDFKPAKTCWNCKFCVGSRVSEVYCTNPEVDKPKGKTRFITLPYTMCEAWKSVKELTE